MGLLLVLLVLLAAAVAPNVLGKRLPGAAAIGPIPGPPAVGDCLLQPTHDDGWRIVDQKPVYTSLELGPCDGSRYGEVAAVIAGGVDAGTVKSAGPGGDVSIVDPNQNACEQAVAGYVGAPSSTAPNVANQWTLAFGFGSGAAAPDDLQIRFGQKWLACLVFATGDTTTDTDAQTVAYSGTVRDSFSTGRLPSVLGSCLSTAVSVRPMPCRQPHGAELFGSISTNPAGTTAALLAANCRAVVGKYTGMVDPTAGGRLSMQVRGTHVIREKVFQGLGPPGDATGFATCVVTTTSTARHLTGPLLGLGSGPVPLA